MNDVGVTGSASFTWRPRPLSDTYVRSRLFARVHVVVPRVRFFQSLILLSMDAETEPVAVQKEEEQVSSKEVVRNGCVLLVLRDH